MTTAPRIALADGPLAIDCAAESQRIEGFLRQALRKLNRRGLVLGVSGGIDSAVCLALACRAVGPQRVFALLMPEGEASTDDATGRAARLCAALGVTHAVEDLTAALAAIGCYARRDQAITRLVPGWGPGWKHKIAIGTAPEGGIAHFRLVVQDRDGRQQSHRLPADVYLQLVAATNFKQRLRKTLEYYHAERLNHAVLGTPNRLEYDLGFFVRGGDGLADVKPIAHLYKAQVYALAAHLGIPEDIRRQPPSTDTYSLPQTQEEFYFALPWQQADLALHALHAGTAAAELAERLGCGTAEAEAVLRDFRGKRKAAARGLAPALVPGLMADGREARP